MALKAVQALKGFILPHLLKKIANNDKSIKYSKTAIKNFTAADSITQFVSFEYIGAASKNKRRT
jgi:hypothetical protein